MKGGMKNDNTIDDGYLIIIEFHNNTYIYYKKKK